MDVLRCTRPSLSVRRRGSVRLGVFAFILVRGFIGVGLRDVVLIRVSGVRVGVVGFIRVHVGSLRRN